VDEGGPAGQIVSLERPEEPTFGQHLFPFILLLMVLLGVVIKDLFFTKSAPSRPVAASSDDDGIPVETQPGFALKFNDGSMTFGIALSDGKKLTFSNDGAHNDVYVKIDDADRLFGAGETGQWKEPPAALTDKGYWGKTKEGKKGTWAFNEKVHVTQTVEIIPGEVREVSGKLKRYLDTCLVRYQLQNKDSQAHRVGLRVLLDTYAGAIDGVPFSVPGLPELVRTFKDFPAPELVPTFVAALENDDFRNPGAVPQLGLKVSRSLEAPGRVLITRWPGEKGGWNVNPQDMSGDSALVLYWEQKELAAGAQRELGFTYGEGNPAGDATGVLGMLLGGEMVSKGEFTVLALVRGPVPGQSVTLKLPKGLELVAGQADRQDVPQIAPNIVRPISHVSWRVKANDAIEGTITVELESGLAKQTSVERKVKIRAKSIY
jgi:hypothetical protein